MFALVVIGHTTPGPRYPLTARPTVVGRAPDCDIVLADASISRRHAAIWQGEDGVEVQDLSSRNGTHIDGKRVQGTARVKAGQIIRLGHVDYLRVVKLGLDEDPTLPLLALEELRTGHRILLTSSPLRIGSDPSCQLQLAEGPPCVAAIIRQGPSEAWLGQGDEMDELVVDQAFPLAGREYVLRLLPPSPVQTIGDGPAELAYRVAATLMDDDDVAIGVWGRDGPVRQLKVLVCRVRQELREAGLDPWFVEKRRGALRLRVVEATIDGKEAR